MGEEDEFGDLYAKKVLSSSSSDKDDDDDVAAVFSSLKSLGSLFRLLEDDPEDFKQGSILSGGKMDASIVVSERGLERKEVDSDNKDGKQNVTEGLERKEMDADNIRKASGGLERKDVDTDSEDDIKIVLEPLDQRMRTESNGNHSSEDSEDGEDFVILNGDKGHNGNIIGGYKGSPQIGYSSQGYQRNYQYARSTGYGRAMPLKHGSIQGDWIGGGRGIVRSQRISLSTRRNTNSAVYKHGLDYSLPSKKTIFDIDIESLDEKPWRHPSGDTSDYFNYGFDESSWKDYCHKLAQYRLESSNSKIEVYESGSSAQEFDPDLPPELAIVASKGRPTNDGIAGKTYFQGHTLAHATQVDGGLWEQCLAVDTQGGLVRESDAISLINVASSKEESLSDDHCPEDYGTTTKMTHDISPRSQLDFCKSTRETLNSQIMITTESQAYFFRHIIPSPAATLRKVVQGKRETNIGRSYSTSLNYGSQVLQKNQNNGTHKSVEERRKCSGPMICRQKKSSTKINGNKGGFTGVLLRKCKNRGHTSDKWNQSRCEDIFPVQMPLQSSIGLTAAGSICGSEAREKKNQFRGYDGLFERDLNRDTLMKRSFTYAVEKVVKVPVKINRGKREALVKNKCGLNKVVRKESSGLDKMPDFLWEGNGELKKGERNDLTIAKKRKKVELKRNSVCRISQQSQGESNHRIVINGNQGTRNKLVKCFISKDKHKCRDYIHASSRISMSQNIRDNMFSGKEKLPIQYLETEEKLDKKDLSYLSSHHNNSSIKHTSVFGTTNYDRPQLGFSNGKRNHTKKLMGSLKLLQTLKKSREKKSSLQHGAGLHSGNKPQFLNFRKKIGSADTVQVVSEQGRELHSEFKGEICREIPKEIREEADCFADVEDLSPIYEKKRKVIKQLPKLNCVPVEQKQRTPNMRRQERGKCKLKQSDAADLGDDRRNKVCSGSVTERKNDNPPSKLGKDRKRVYSASEDDWKNENEDHYYKHSHTNMPSDNITLKVPDEAIHETLLDGKEHALFDIDKTEQNHHASETLFLHQESLHEAMSTSSQDESHHRGRSKFERWTSHSEQVMEDMSQGMISGGNRISFSKRVRGGTSQPYICNTDGLSMEGNSNAQTIRAQKTGKKRNRSKMVASQEIQGLNNACNGEEIVVSEISEKFVKHRECFQDQMVEEGDPSSILENNHLSNLTVEMKAERPRRKRRWGGG